MSGHTELREKIGGYIDAIRLGATNEGVTNAIMRDIALLVADPYTDLVKVLQFYASEWQPNGEGDPETPGLFRSWDEPTAELQNDGGRKAREALCEVAMHDWRKANKL